MAGKKMLNNPIKRIHIFEKEEYELFAQSTKNTSAMLRALIHRYLQEKGLIQ